MDTSPSRTATPEDDDAPRRSPRGPQRTPPGPPSRRVPCTNELFDKGRKFVNSRRHARHISEDERLMILNMHLHLRHSAFLTDSKNPHRVKKGAPIKRNISERVAKLSGRSEKVCKDVWSEWLRNGKVEERPLCGNRSNHPTKLKYTFRLITSIREFIRANRRKHRYITAVDLLHFMRKRKLIVVADTNLQSKEFKAAQRLVQRTIHRLGYIRAKSNPNAIPAMPLHIIEHRNRYLRVMQENRELPRRQRHRLVYTDESYIHHHYNRLNASIIDPTHGEQGMVAHKKLGRRFCFVAALVGPDPRVIDARRSKGTQSFILDSSIHIFKGGEVKLADGTLRPQPEMKISKDYHGMFNSEYYVQYMEVLLKGLDEAGVVQAYIVMDNASYHKFYPENYPKGNMTKAAMLAAMEEIGYEPDITETRAEIWQKFRRHRDANLPFVIEKMAADRGHKVIYTPPYHCEIQPIERVWAQVKNKVAVKYHKDITFEQVRENLKNAFESLTYETLDGIIAKSLKEEMRLHTEMLQDDTCTTPEDVEELSDNSFDIQAEFNGEPSHVDEDDNSDDDADEFDED